MREYAIIVDHTEFYNSYTKYGTLFNLFYILQIQISTFSSKGFVFIPS